MNDSKFNFLILLCLILFSTATAYYYLWSHTKITIYIWSSFACGLMFIIFLIFTLSYKYGVSVFKTPEKVLFEDIIQAYQKTKTVWTFSNNELVPIQEIILNKNNQEEKFITDTETYFVLYLWPSLESITICKDLPIFHNYTITRINPIELLIRLRNMVKEFGDKLFISLYSYPKSGPIFTQQASQVGAKFACNIFGIDTAEHYVRFLEYECNNLDSNESITEMITKTEPQKYFLSKFFRKYDYRPNLKCVKK